MQIQKTIRRGLYRGLGSVTVLSMLALASGGFAPAAFAQTTDTSSSTSMTGSTTPVVTTGSTTDTTGSTTTGTGSTTTASSTTSTTTSTTTTPVDWNSLISQLQSLEASLSMLLQQIEAAIASSGTSGTGTGTTGTGTIDQNGQTVTAGSVMDFSGRNFMHEENVTVTMNGNVVGNAHADGGGNFTTGNMQVPTTPGTYVYTFTGQNGDVTQATITAQ